MSNLQEVEHIMLTNEVHGYEIIIACRSCQIYKKLNTLLINLDAYQDPMAHKKCTLLC